jgi:arylsulfatase
VEGWRAEAGKYNVLPLDDRFSERLLGREEDIRERAKILYTFYTMVQ